VAANEFFNRLLGKARIAFKRLISADLFVGLPNTFLKAKSLVGRIPSGTGILELQREAIS